MAQTINLSIDQGSTFVYNFNLQTTSLNLTNATAIAKMMTEYDEANSAVPFSSSLYGNTMTLELSANVTGNLTPGTWVYDAVVVDQANNWTRVVQGRIWVRPGATLP